MKPLLDVVTPVSRTHLLQPLRLDIQDAERHFDIQWWVIHDCLAKAKTCARFNIAAPRGRKWYRKHHLAVAGSEAGWGQRNWHLDHGRPDAYVWWLDDDTRIPARFFPALAADLESGADAVVYAMQYPLPPFAEAQGITEPKILHPDPDRVEVGGISGSMAIFRRECVGDLRARLERTSDGTFLRELFQRIPRSRVLWVDDPLILYNAQDPERWQ